MPTARIGLSPWIEGEIRHQSVTNRLQGFQSVTNLFTFGSVKNSRIKSDRFNRSADFLCTLMTFFIRLKPSQFHPNSLNLDPAQMLMFIRR